MEQSPRRQSNLLDTSVGILIGILALSALGPGSPAWAGPSCPLGPRQDHLTIHQVMINFGSYTLAADTLAEKFVMPYEDVSNDLISTAAKDLDIAKACAEAVLANPSGDLLPSGMNSLSAADREKMVSDFLAFMIEFHDALLDYRDGCLDLLREKPEVRNFKNLFALHTNLTAIANRAHGKLGTTQHLVDLDRPMLGMHSLSTNADIGVVMKQIGKLFSSLKNSDNDESRNAANAQAALQMANLFDSLVGATPDAIKDLPADQRAAAQAGFDSMIRHEANDCRALRLEPVC